jgi:peptidoglycan/LPS O-acetylase OafA/YrhL
MKTRIQFLDNLRTLMIFLVVLLHAGMTYMDGFDAFWIVSDPGKINALGLINMYIDIFVMFTIFFISGYLVPLSLHNKTTKGFLISKVKRILLPWLLAVFTLIPAYKFIFLYSRGLPQEEWYSYFHLFSRGGDNAWFFANNPAQSWLWFLPVLFLFQMVYLALSKLNFFNIRLSFKTGIILTMVAGIVYNMVISSLGLTGWFSSWLIHFQRERLLVYFLIFLLGSLAFKHRIFNTEVKNKKLYITANVLLTIALGLFTAIALNLFFNIIDPDRNYYFISPFVDKTAYYTSSMVSMLSFLYVLLYAFRFSLNKTNWILENLNRGSYQVYIIHMIVLGLVALLLISSGMPAFVKYILLVVITYALSNFLVWIYNRLTRDHLILKAAVALVFLLAILISANSQSNEQNNQKIESTAMVQKNATPELSLHAAIIANDMETVRQHIAIGSNLDIPEPAGGSSPLITASLFSRKDIVELLVEAGADINFQNNDGSTALHTAAFFCYEEITKLLLERGADRLVKNNSGSTALESASVPYEQVQPIYEYFKKTLSPLGLQLDFEHIKETRPEIANLLSIVP